MCAVSCLFGFCPALCRACSLQPVRCVSRLDLGLERAHVSVCVWVDMKFINLFHVKCIFTIKCTTPVNLQCSTRLQESSRGTGSFCSAGYGHGFVFGITLLYYFIGIVDQLRQLLFVVVVVVVVAVAVVFLQCTHWDETAPKRNARRTTIKQIMAFSSLCCYSGEFNSNFAIYATFNRLLNFLAPDQNVYV